MSGARSAFYDGMEDATADIQRLADAAAGMDDLVHMVYLFPSDKRVMALGAEYDGNAGIGTPSYQKPLPLVTATTGAVVLNPCHLITAGAGKSGFLNGTLASSIASNSSGVTRYDLFYAKLSQTTVVSGTRRIKSTVDGSISSASKVLQDKMAITVGIVQNVSSSTPLASLSADTSTDFYFGLAVVLVPNGYTAGGAVTHEQVTPLWTGAFVEPHRIQGFRVPTLMGSTATGDPGMGTLSGRWGSLIRVAGFFRNPAIHTAMVFDQNIDWSGRMITRMSMTRLPGPSGAHAYLPSGTQTGTSGGIPTYSYPAAGVDDSDVTKVFAGPIYTGPPTRLGLYPSGVALVSFVLVSSTYQIDVSLGGHGELKLTTQTAPQTTSQGGDLYWFDVEATDQFDF